MRKVDLGLLVVGLPAILALAFYPVSKESSSLVPTIINGVATSTSVIVTFTGLLMTLGISSKLVELQGEKRRLYFTIVFLGLSGFLLFLAYITEMMSLDTGNFVESLKLSMVGLVISIETFVSFMDFIILQIYPEARRPRVN